jgi:radical SAM superfamily enzyme with C-terminal helix-hairpin-helix motif
MMVLVIGGLAIFIAAIAITIGGLALPGRYSGAIPPPNIGALGTAQVVGGIALMALGALIMASAGALLANLSRSRALAMAVSTLAALLAAAGVVLLLGVTNKDLALIVALAVTVIAFGGAAVVLGRLRR